MVSVLFIETRPKHCHLVSYDGDKGWKQTHMYVSPHPVTLLIFADTIPDYKRSFSLRYWLPLRPE